MRIVVSSLLTFLLFITCHSISNAKTTVEALAHKAVSGKTSESVPAISQLREMGPAGLDALLRSHATEIERYATDPNTNETPEWKRLSAALDEVSQQKDSYLSGLYWYTDFGQARKAAQASGKPILSLRLLGRLSEEYSCANSRFFRAILYSNSQVSKLLKDRFVLHWNSVRPAPRVTIDFGDGRKLESTVTGNSIHYILDSEGRLLDALPGLYGPGAFQEALHEVLDLFSSLVEDKNDLRAEILGKYHQASLRRITERWLADLEAVGGKIPQYLVRQPTSGSATAVAIAPLAITKMATEVTLLRAITRDADSLGSVTDEDTWKKIAHRHMEAARMDKRSISLIQRQLRGLPLDLPQMNLTRLLEMLQENVALDTIRNVYMLRTKLHAWMMVDRTRNNLEAFNQKVYAELFLTPSSDPWMGLFSPDVYVGLQNSGLKQ